MQQLVPTVTHNPNGHTAAEIQDAINGRTGGRKWSFRYDLLDSANAYVQALDGIVESCKITQDWLASVKRKADFTIRDTGEIDYLSDRIQPWARLHLPPYGDDDWAEWPQGVFMLASPSRADDESRAVHRTVTAYDLLQELADDKVSTRYTVDVGTAYTTAVATLLANFTTNITASTATLPAAREWDPGTPKLRIINDLLAAVNYESLSFDEDGMAVVKPYVAPSDRSAEWTYADDATGLMVPGIDQTLDLFNVANQWTLVVSSPDRAVLSSTYTNNDPGSPTSTIRRGRTIVDFRTEQDAADQASLDAKVARLAFEASQVYEVLELGAGAVPHLSGNDVVWVRYSPLAINAKYASQSWSWTLKAGEPIRHKLRRVVTV